MRYSAIIFDMGDIFFDATLWRRSLTAYLQQTGVAIDYPTLCQQWETKLVPVYRGECAYWSAFRHWLGELGLNASEIAQIETFARKKASEVETRTLFDGVAETLAQLKAAGTKLAVLSDTESPETQVRHLLAKLGIERYFDAVVTSVDVGHAKPAPEAYACVLKRLGASPSETAFVGHDAEELEGALRSGLTAIAFNCEPSVAPQSLHLSHFSGLLAVAAGIDAG